MNRYIRVLVFLLLIFFIWLTYSIQNYIDTKIYHPPKTEDLKYLPSGKFLKAAALAYDELLSDLLWIKALAYFGEHDLTDQKYDWLYHILDITTILDPKFEDPYEFGGIICSNVIGNVDNSITILKKGIENVQATHSRYWYLYFFTAFNYMYFKDDYATAAVYLEKASKFPKSPSYLPLLVARLYANADNPDIAIKFLEEMLQSTGSPELKAQLARRISEVAIEKDLQIFEKAKNVFLKKYGKNPVNINDFVKFGILDSIPLEPLGGKYYIAEDKSIKTTSDVKRLKVHIVK